jgi:hypothetical protein
MLKIDSKKIIGIRIQKDNGEFCQMSHEVGDNNNSWRVVEFKSVEDVNKFIRMINRFKNEYIKREKGEL